MRNLGGGFRHGASDFLHGEDGATVPGVPSLAARAYPPGQRPSSRGIYGIIRRSRPSSEAPRMCAGPWGSVAHHTSADSAQQFFSMSEILVTLNDNKVKVRAEKGTRSPLPSTGCFRTPTISLHHPGGHHLAGFLSSAFANDAPVIIALAQKVVPALKVSVLKPAAMMAVTLVLSYFTIVLGEMVPKRIAMIAPERISYGIVGIIHFMSRLFSPLVRLLSASTNFLVWLFRIDANKGGENVTEEEIRLMVDVGEEEGTIQENERILIHNVFNFDTQSVTDIMTHRTEIVGVDVNTPYDEVRRIAVSEQYSRYPVYEGTVDNIVGIIHLKDLLMMDDKGPAGVRPEAGHEEPYFVPRPSITTSFCSTCSETRPTWPSSSTSTAERRGSSPWRISSRRSWGDL